MSPSRRIRRACVCLHRWTGLVIALFLVITGATGSILAFGNELDALINPNLFRVAPPRPGAPMLDPLVLRARVEGAYPSTVIDWVPLDTMPGHALRFGLGPAPGMMQPLADDEVFVDPYTGRVVGARRSGDLGQGLVNLVPFVDELHTSLLLGTVGRYVLGIAALLWTFDCFVGFYLTLPAPHDRRRRPLGATNSRARAWLRRWSYAWKLRWSASVTKLNFDWHRASGLWIWALLFVIAWSSVGFNLREAYVPAMRATFGYDVPRTDLPDLATPLADPPIKWPQARAHAAVLMAEAAQRDGFTVLRERLIHYDATRGLYGYRTLSTLDVGRTLGNTTLYFDARDGRLLRLDRPTGVHAGNTIDAWIGGLHTASVGGLAIQLAICITGIATVALSATGIVIWWQRRKARLVSLRLRLGLRLGSRA